MSTHLAAPWDTAPSDGRFAQCFPSARSGIYVT